MRTALKIALALLAALLAAPALAQSPTNVYVVDFTSNTTIAVSAAGHLRLRFNSGTGVLEQSIAGAAYTTLVPTATLASTYAAGTGAASSIMSLDSTRAGVIVRDSSPSSGSPLFAVQNNAANSFLSITPTSQQFIRSGATDGAAAVGLAVDTFNGFANATSKILRVLTGNAERFFITGPGTVNLMAATAISGSGAFDLSAASGVFKSSTGAHTFGSATWSTPANLAVTVGASATNTVGLLLTPNVAAGATSVALQVNNTTALATGFLAKIGDNGVARFQMSNTSTDGFLIQDSGGSSTLNMSTNAGTVLAYGAHFFSAGSTSISLSDATNTWAMTGGVMTGQQLKMLPVSNAQTAASQSWRDSAGAGHYGVDASGFPSLGSMFTFYEPWLMNQTLSASQTNAVFTGGLWKYTTTANASSFTSTSGCGSATNSPLSSCVNLSPGTTSTNSTIVQSVSGLIRPDLLTNLYVTQVFPVVLGAVGANGFTFKVGMANGAISGTHPGGWYFQKANGDTNWQCITDDGTTTNTVNSTVPPVANNTQIMRIEYYGSGTVLGAKTVRFYIDSTKVCGDVTNNVYSANVVSYQIYDTSTTTQAAVTSAVGPLSIWYNMAASPLIP